MKTLLFTVSIGFYLSAHAQNVNPMGAAEIHGDRWS